MRFLRTDHTHPGFVQLVRELDQDLARRDGKDNAFYARYNSMEADARAVVAIAEGVPVGCGAIKPVDADAMEVKRMYTLPAWRGKGVASRVLAELEQWARELGMERCILETGLRQPEAIALYESNGYAPIPNYGPYAGVANSRCFAKVL
ncbi:MAG: GNAT family N-acetyltransferase [Flavobacteriales bacterium]|nr:GNAT family N-acetyltransferase [Flavobacteriales bacterium]